MASSISRKRLGPDGWTVGADRSVGRASSARSRNKTPSRVETSMLFRAPCDCQFPPIQPPSCTPPGLPVFDPCSTLCNVRLGGLAPLRQRQRP